VVTEGLAVLTSEDTRSREIAEKAVERSKNPEGTWGSYPDTRDRPWTSVPTKDEKARD
jgi:hypothetical protein